MSPKVHLVHYKWLLEMYIVEATGCSTAIIVHGRHKVIVHVNRKADGFDIAWDRVFYEYYTGTSTRASYHVYCIKHEHFSCYNMCFISRRPLTNRVIKVIQYRKGLYEFYYTLVTLTTGYKEHYYTDKGLPLRKKKGLPPSTYAILTTHFFILWCHVNNIGHVLVPHHLPPLGDWVLRGSVHHYQSAWFRVSIHVVGDVWLQGRCSTAHTTHNWRGGGHTSNVLWICRLPSRAYKRRGHATHY